MVCSPLIAPEKPIVDTRTRLNPSARLGLLPPLEVYSPRQNGWLRGYRCLRGICVGVADRASESYRTYTASLPVGAVARHEAQRLRDSKMETLMSLILPSARISLDPCGSSRANYFSRSPAAPTILPDGQIAHSPYQTAPSAILPAGGRL